MSDQSNILREYLVALGFKVDEAGVVKVDGAISKIDKRVGQLAKMITAVAAATKAMVTVFSYQMEKLYYSAQRAESSAGKMQALEYAWRQLGGSGDAMKGAVEGMASALRQNPGLIALLENLGVDTQGGKRDRAEILMDFVKALKEMPPYIAAQYAKLFGIDEGMLFTLTQNLDKFNAAQEERLRMSREAGVDMEQATEAGREYAEMMRRLTTRVGILADALSIKLLPMFKAGAEWLDKILSGLTKVIGASQSFTDFMSKMKNWAITGDHTKDAEAVIEGDKPAPTRLGRMAQWARRQSWLPSSNLYTGDHTKGQQPPPGSPQTAAALPAPPGVGMDERQAYLASLELKYGLPPGWLDRVWKKESGRGRNMLSPKGAKGHFQFMDPTAKDYGLKNPYDFNESADAAARKYRDLFRMFGGDPAKAAAAYNWGQGNVQRRGLGAMPKETRDYVNEVAGPVIYQNNPITISGVSDPKQAAEFAANEQRRNNADLVRDLRTGVR